MLIHEKIVQKIFKKLVDKGDIYKNSYTGLYCSGCEAFLSEKDLTEDGLCPDHLKKPEVVSEENYFFKLTKYKDAIIKHIKTNPDFIVPSFRANEVLNQLENIEDISVSRAKSNVSWGIPVLGDDDQVIYVWIDALSNYITALGYNPDGESEEKFKNFWPADVQVIGKDILKFHSIYWIAILMALDLPLPKHILAHGWITIDQTKMSKSLGNVISPTGVLEAFNLEIPDPLRYYMATAAPCGKDGNYSDEDFKEKALETIKAVKHHFDYFEIQEAALKIMELVDFVHKYVTDNAPWTLAKEGQMEKCGVVLTNVLEIMTVISSLIYPYCPNIAKSMSEQLGYDLNTKLDDITCEVLQAGHLIDKENITPVFLRVDSELADKKGNK